MNITTFQEPSRRKEGTNLYGGQNGAERDVPETPKPFWGHPKGAEPPPVPVRAVILRFLPPGARACGNFAFFTPNSPLVEAGEAVLHQ